MKNTRSLLLVVLLSTPFSLAMAAESPDVDDVTMDVVKHSDPSEVTNDIKLPEAMETEDHSHDGEAHAKDDPNDDADEHAEDSKEHGQESKEHAEDSKDDSQESATQSQDDMK